MATVEMRATVELGELGEMEMLQEFFCRRQSTFSCRSLTAQVSLGGFMLDRLAWRWVAGLTSSRSTARPKNLLSSSWCMPRTTEPT
jgi:hypothetical protein